MTNFDLITIGDASCDVFVAPSESESLCQLNNKESLVCFAYGKKIPVKEMEFTIGGNAANNAVGIKRLGLKVSVVLTLGNDEIGTQIIDRLQNEGIDTTYVVTHPAIASDYSTIVTYQGERTMLNYKPPRTYEFPVKLPVSPWLYLTSMGDTFRPFYNHLTDFLKSNPEIRLVYNPGSRQLRAPYEQIKDMIARTYVLFVNREEGQNLVKMEDSFGKEKELIEKLMGFGVKYPVITDGANGAFTYDGKKYIKVGVLPVDAYERTGAGDAFGSGCLAGLIKGKPFEEALVWGTVNSASVIGYTGSQKGLLRENEMNIWLERAKSSKVLIEEF